MIASSENLPAASNVQGTKQCREETARTRILEDLSEDAEASSFYNLIIHYTPKQQWQKNALVRQWLFILLFALHLLLYTF